MPCQQGAQRFIQNFGHLFKAHLSVVPEFDDLPVLGRELVHGLTQCRQFPCIRVSTFGGGWRSFDHLLKAIIREVRWTPTVPSSKVAHPVHRHAEEPTLKASSLGVRTARHFDRDGCEHRLREFFSGIRVVAPALAEGEDPGTVQPDKFRPCGAIAARGVSQYPFESVAVGGLTHWAVWLSPGDLACPTLDTPPYYNSGALACTRERRRHAAAYALPCMK